MRARFINEIFTDESDPIKDMGIGLGDLVKLPAIFPTDYDAIYKKKYTYFHNLIKKGFIIVIAFEDKVMAKMYKELNELMVPFFQNDTLEDRKGNYYWGKGEKNTPKRKNEIYTATHMCTHGRHNTKDTIYKGKNNHEYPFFVRGDTSYDLSFIISKSQKLVTLCIEGDCPKHLRKKYFNQGTVGDTSDWYLGEWKKPEEIIELVKTLF